MKKIRLGIIGTGIAAEILHLPAILELDGMYGITAAYNRTRSKSERYAKLAGLDSANIHDDYQTLLKREDVDAVVLAVAPSLNLGMAEEAMQAGKDVICEKPLAENMDEAGELAGLAERYGQQLCIAENFRYEESVAKGKELLDAGAIGKPFSLNYRWMQHVPADDIIASRPWRKESGMPGGAFCDHGIHMVDVLRYLGGELEAVGGIGRNVTGYINGIDTAHFHAVGESGMFCSVQWSFGVYGDTAFSIEIQGDRGSMVLTQDELRLESAEESRSYSFAGKRSSFYHEFYDFYRCIAAKEVPRMTVHDGLMDLKTLGNIYSTLKITG